MNVSCNGYAIDNNRPIRPLYVGTAAKAHLPDAVQLWTPPVLDQGQSMACTGMAGAVMVDVAAHKMGKDFRASPRGLWTLARYSLFSPGEPLQNSGAHFRSVFDNAMKFGVIHEDDCPWDLSRLNEDIGFDAAIAGQGQRLSVEGWYSLDETGDDRMIAIQSALAQGFAVGGAWRVTEQFCRLGDKSHFVQFRDSHGSIGLVYNHESDTSPWAGNHALAIVGYEMVARRPWFKIQNSWGTSFGGGGFCWFTSDVVDEAWDLTVVRAIP
jgi:hypothetical protein